MSRPKPSREPSARQQGAAALDASALYRGNVVAVARWVRRLAGPGADVEDLVHDVFMVAFRRLSEFDPETGPFASWLYGITLRTVQAWRRRVRLRARLVAPFTWLRSSAQDAEPIDPRPIASDELEREQARRHLYHLLDRIGEKYRTALILFEIEALTGEQIAQLLQVSVETVWVRVHRARQKLAEEAALVRAAERPGLRAKEGSRS
jgi:RNA polymerase sigma-70 factor (ECF subfamily)